MINDKIILICIIRDVKLYIIGLINEDVDERLNIVFEFLMWLL